MASNSLIAVACAALLLQACAPAPITPSSFTVATRDDPMQRSVVLRSSRLPTKPPNTLDFNRFDFQLFAAIDRKSQEVSYGVRHSMSWHASTWFSPQAARYMSASGALVDAGDFVRLPGDVSCRGGCTFDESSTFAVTRQTLDEISKTSVPWRIRIYGKAAYVDGTIDPALIAPFLAEVDHRRDAMIAAKKSGI